MMKEGEIFFDTFHYKTSYIAHFIRFPIGSCRKEDSKHRCSDKRYKIC